MSPTGEIFVDIYEDHGCHLAPSCLSCPLELCKHDTEMDGGTHSRIRRAEVHEQIMQLLETGTLREKVAEKTGVSLRTVDRVRTRGGLSQAMKDAQAARTAHPEIPFGDRYRRQFKQRKPWPVMPENQQKVSA